MQTATIPEQIKICIIVPAYQEAKRIGEVVRAIRRHVSWVLVVDDGSSDETARMAEEAGAVVMRHEQNRGKGEALKTGFEYAQKTDCDLVVTMDADGQHDPDDPPRFIDAYRRTGIPVLLGNRMGARSQMPLIRRLTNRIMSWMISRTMRQYIPDTQCGYRLFRRDVLPFLAAESPRFAAESEMLLHLAERHFRIDNVRVKTIYRDERSKIKPIADTWRFWSMMLHYHRRKRRRRL